MCAVCGCQSRGSRFIKIEKDILSRNNHQADINRSYFKDHAIFALNLVSSPGSGKTTLLVETVNILKDEFSVTVIEGDQQTDFDTERIRKTGVNALQINTGKGCHLDSLMVKNALGYIKPVMNSILFIENVGNLVCPAAFDLGESKKVVILSVTEGSDKPLKYPDIFVSADLLIVNKTDLLPYVDFDMNLCFEYARRINPQIQIMQLSAVKGDGMESWIEWIKHNRENC